ncbi:MAG: hypothetical protein NT051_06435 [Candidatus Micrarchaeota archaeon]|nr:hypothetical protein [Candidatus Micrarchaeota archaeon]
MAGIVKGEKKNGSGSFRLSEGGKQALFAALVAIALLLAAYAVFLMPASDPRSEDGSEFYFLLRDSPTVGMLYDAREVTSGQAQSIYQCGVEMISKGRFAGKSLLIVACDSTGCESMSTSTNGSNRMTFEQAGKEMTAMPYVLIKPGESGYAFYKRHMEISIGKNVTGNINCDISATESQ